MSENKQNLDEVEGSGPWWKGAVQIFSQISVWIVVPIVLALIFGKMLDTHYGTRPFIFLAFIFMSFLFSCFGIVRVIKNYMKTLQDIEDKK